MDIITYALAKKYADRIVAEVGQGIPGKSAYEIAVEHGFVGTEEEWLESLIPELDGYYNEENLVKLSTTEINEICK